MVIPSVNGAYFFDSTFFTIADQSSAEDTAWSYVVPAGAFSDVDGDSLTYSATLADGSALPTWLTFNGGTRTFSGTPPQDYNGTTSLKVTASDGSLSVSDTFVLTVTGVNDAPVVANAIADQSSAEDTAWSYQVPVGAFSDVDGDSLSYSATLGNGSALPTWLTFNGTTRTFSGTPPQDFAGDISLKVTASDGTLSASDTFTLSVTAVNDAPTVAATQSVTTSEDVAKQVTVSASDADGDTLSWSAGAASHGTVSGGTDGVFTYTPTADYAGSDSFTVTVSDGQGGSRQQVVSVSVSASEDEATGSVSVSGTAAEGSTVSASVSATDVDGAITDKTYQWQVSSDGSTGWSNLSGATAQSYAIASDQSQVGKYLRVVATTTDALGGTTTFTSAATTAIANVNDAPVVASAIADQSSAEDTAWSYQVPVGAFSDVDGDALSYSATLADGSALPTWLTFNGATRTFSGTPPQDYNGTTSLKVTASDGSLSASDTFVLTVTGVNDAPVVANAIADQSSAEDTAWSYQVPVGAFSDVDGDSLSYSATLGNGSALPTWLTFNGTTRTFSGTPPQDFAGDISLKVTASDGTLSASDTFTLSVTAVNDAPTVAATQSVTTSEDVARQVTVSASDADGDALSWSAGAASHGTVSGGTDGVFTYTPTADYAGSDSFTVTVSDGQGGSRQQVVSVSVSAAEDEATGSVSVSGTAAEGSTVSASVSATDVDGAITDKTYQWQVSSDGSTGWSNLSGATAQSYAIASDQSQVGKYLRVVATTTDALGGTTTFTSAATTAIANVNDAPVVASAIADQSSAEDTAWSYVVPAGAFSDVDGDALSYSATLADGSALPTWLTFNGATRTFSGTPPQDYNGTTSLKVTASDGSLSVSDTFVLTVTGVNDAPVVANAIADQSSAEDTAWSYQVPVGAFSDVDGDSLSYSATLGNGSALPTWLTFNGTTRTFSGTPPQDFAGDISLKVTASDGTLSASDTFTLSVTAVNDAPTVAATQSVTTSEDVAKQVTVSASDADGDTLSWSAGAASHGTVSGGTDGVFTYTPTADYAGSDSFTVTVSDGQGGSRQQVVSVSVSASEDEATGSVSVSGTAAEGSTVSASVSATDVDGAITDKTYQWQVSSDGSTGWSNLSGATAQSYAIASDQSQVGKYLRVVATTTDALGGTTTFTSAATTAIANVNDAPVVASAIADQSSAEDTAWSYQVPVGAFSDVDGDALSYSATLADGSALPTWLTFNGATRTFSGTPPQDYNGTTSLKVTASDGSLSVSDTFVLTVTGVNDAPVVANAIADQSSAEDTAWSYQVPVGAFSDVDGDSLSYSATLGNGSALPTWLTFNGTTRTFSGTPPQDFAGDISLKVTASDGTLSASDTFTLSVTAVNDAPTVAATQSVTTSEDVARQVTVSASDADGDALSWSAGAASHGTVSGGTDGVFTYTPTADYAGSDSFTVTVSDGQGGSRQQVVSVSVSAAEDEAVGGVSVSGTVAEGGSVSASVTATDVDGAIAGTTYQWQVSSDGSTGWNNLSGATAASYAIASDQSQVGKYLRVVATTTDALGGATVFTSDATAAIANVNDAPVVASNVADQSSAEDAAWSYQVPANVFSDVDGDTLSYSATLGDGSALPTWLTFNAATRTFSGTPPQDFAGDISLKVTASDGSLSASDTFVLSIEPPLQIISGTSGNDTLSGVSGNVSEITGGGGNDTIIGGGRADVAVFSGNRSDYTITTVAGVTTVRDNRAGSPDGTDTLKGLNLLRFADIQLFQTTAANKMTLAGQAQTYNVANSQVVQGTNAAERFMVAPETSALVFAGTNDVVDLVGAIDSYTFTKTGTQLQISDGLYTTTLSVGGSFTLRTASGSTSVAIDFAQGGAIKLGGTQVVGSATFDPLAAILDAGNVPSASGVATLQRITGTSGNDALSGVAGKVNQITGGAGNDTITGGSRADIAVFSGNRSNYTITTLAGVTTVVDNRAGSPDGTDTLKGLNILHFADLQLFQSTAANKMILAGQAQTYNVDNSEVVQGTSAAEHFIVGQKTSALVFAGNNDVVDLSGAIDSYSFTKTGTQLQISDSLYTTTLSVGGSFTLRTASGSTSVAIDFAQGGAIKLGGTQVVGSATFDPLAAILDPGNYSDNAEFRHITVKSGVTYNGHAGVADVFVIDASQSLTATIAGFEAGDVLKFTNHSGELGVSVEQAALGDALATMLAGNATINLTALANDNFNNEVSFEAIYGANAIGYVI